MKRRLFLFLVALAFLQGQNSVYAQGQLWGVTPNGGSSDLGVIFKTDITGANQSVTHEFFTPYPGSGGGDLILAPNGKMYGVNNSLYEYDIATGIYTPKHKFLPTAYDGVGFAGKLVVAPNGKLYGVMNSGGSGYGTLFEYDPISEVFTVKNYFSPSINGPSGINLGSNGKLYGATQRGGVNDRGTLFEYDITSNTLTRKADLDNVGGMYPTNIIEASNGKFYGMTQMGGSSGHGILFEYDLTAGTLVKKIDFTGANGSQPRAPLLQATDGNLYGMTYAGGSASKGVFFQYTIASNTLQVRKDFGVGGYNIEAYPMGSPIQASNGLIYGVSGSNSLGVVFEYNTSTATLVNKALFVNGYNAGNNPRSTLTEGNDGKLYGTTSWGGVVTGDNQMAGTMYSFDPATNALSTLFSFNKAPDGARPDADLLLASNGKLYGISSAGGNIGNGFLFEFDRITHSYVNRFEFNTTYNGLVASGSLIQATNGKLYGLSKWELFEFDLATSTYTMKINLYPLIGAGTFHPFYGSVIQASNGRLYAMTNVGGANDKGILFEFDLATNSYVKRLDFSTTTGGKPLGPLYEAANGKLYGLTSQGGANNEGTIFEYEIATNTFNKRFDFSSASGVRPNGGVIEASDGKFYGFASGGMGNNGCIFQFDPVTNTCQKKDLYGYGVAPSGTLVEATPGKLYGMTAGNGYNIYGGIIEYDYNTNSLATKTSFNLTNGKGAGTKLLIDKADQIITFDPLPPKEYKDEPFTLTATTTSGLPITYSSSNPAVATVSGNVVTILSSGTTELAATQSGDASYNPATAVLRVLTVYKSQLVVTAENKTRLYGDVNPAFTITYSGFKGTEDESVLDLLPEAVSSATNTSNAGSYPITLSGGTDSNYSFSPVNGTLTINKAQLTASANNAVKIYGDVNPAFNVSYSGFIGTDDADDLDIPPTLSSTSTANSDAGTYPITPADAIDNNYSFVFVNGTLTVNKAVLTASADDKTKLYGEVNPELTFTYAGFKGTDHAGMIETQPSISTTATVSSAVGIYPITLTGGADENYTFVLVANSLTVHKANQLITFNLLPVKTYGDPAFILSATSSSGLPVHYDSSDPSVATVTGNTVTITGGGITVITASQAGDGNYNPASDVMQSLHVSTANQTITFSPLPIKTYEDIPFTLGATASSGLSVSYSSSDPSVATVSGNTVTIVGAGTTTITASQAGNTNYAPASDVLQSLTVNKANQAITFLLGADATKTYGDASFTLNASGGNSGNPVTFTSSDPTVATVSGNTVAIIGAGTSTITASQAGTENYNAAPDVVRVLTINKADQVITFNAPADKNYGDSPFGLTATSSSGLAVSFESSDTGVAAISGSTVSILSGGTATITASQAGNANYNPAPEVQHLFTVNVLPPATAASYIEFNNVWATQMDIAVTAGDGNNRLIVIRPLSPVNFVPVDDISYPAGTVIGDTRVILSGNATSLTVTGLQPSTRYYVKVYEFNEYGRITYLTGGAPTASQQTIALPVVYVTTPANNAVNQNISLTVTALAVTGATTYTLELNTSPDFTGTSIVRTGVRNPNFSGLAYSTQYYSRVKTNLSPDYGEVRTFTTGAPELFTYVNSPANNATNVSVNPTVASIAVSGATTYTIELNTAADFTGTSFVKSGTASQAFTGLSVSTLYYARVKTNLSPNWGPTRSFTTGTAQANSFVVTPTNAATNQLPTLTITANLIAQASTYTIQLSPVSDFSSGIIEVSGPSRTLTFAGLAYFTTYYSRVSTDLSPGQWGPVRNFRTIDNFITAPVAGATNVSWVVNLTSNTITGATSYTIEANTASDFTGTSVVRTGSSPTQGFTLAYDQLYYVRVTTNLASGWGTSIRSFTTGSPVTLAFVTSPANGATNISTTTNVQAAALTGATSYTIELNTAADFTGTSIVKTSASRTISFPGLSQATTYYSRVQTSLAPGQWGTTIRSFTTVNPSGRSGGNTVSNNTDEQEEVYLETFNVKVMGNPFADKLVFIVATPAQEPVKVLLHDLNGKEIHSSTESTNDLIEIAKPMVNGVYILRVRTFAGMSKTIRVMKME